MQRSWAFGRRTVLTTAICASPLSMTILAAAAFAQPATEAPPLAAPPPVAASPGAPKPPPGPTPETSPAPSHALDPNQTPADAATAPAPSDAGEAAPPPPSPASTMEVPPGTPPLQEWYNHSYRANEAAVVFAAPEDRAAPLSLIRPGTSTTIVGRLADPKWLQVEIAPGKTGYVHASAFSAALSDPESAAPNPVLLPVAAISGHALVLDTATLVVDGTTVRLFGVEGAGGAPARQLAQFIASQGADATCEPHGADRFICRLSNGTDIAMAALVNGAATAAADAPDSYRLQQDEARLNHRGLWGAAAAAPGPVAIPPGMDAGIAPPAPLLAEPPPDGDYTIENGEPVAIVDGAAVAVVFAGGLGWGWWDHYHHWHGAPGRWAHEYDRRFPRGAGLRDPGLREREFERHMARPERLGAPERIAGPERMRGPERVAGTEGAHGYVHADLPGWVAMRPEAGAHEFMHGGVHPGAPGPSGGAQGFMHQLSAQRAAAGGFWGIHPNSLRTAGFGMRAPAARSGSVARSCTKKC